MWVETLNTEVQGRLRFTTVRPELAGGDIVQMKIFRLKRENINLVGKSSKLSCGYEPKGRNPAFDFQFPKRKIA